MIKGAGAVAALKRLQCDRFIVCRDADGTSSRTIEDEIRAKVVRVAGLTDSTSCIVVPIQEFEAWILADLDAVKAIMPTFSAADILSPEKIANPKEHLARLSRNARGREQYRSSSHNEVVAPHLDLAKVLQKCPSFKKLADFVQAA
jgi:hypothetical protein